MQLCLIKRNMTCHISINIIFTDYVSPICLPRAEQLESLIMGELLTVAGWGKMNMTTEERAKILQYVAVTIISTYIIIETDFILKFLIK